MHQYTHAWLSLKAVEFLNKLEGKFCEQRNDRLNKFNEFISKHPNTFVRGAWFPDSVIADNLQGGHTWKYYLDANGREVQYKPPNHNKCKDFVSGNVDIKVSLNLRCSNLPDRCEALGQTIRDTILITNSVKSGDVIVFNDSQTALFFLMLSHYICDSHVPVHCDNRDLNDPSKVHWDLEEYWEDEVKKYYKISEKHEIFDLDENQRLQRNTDIGGWEESILYKVNQITEDIVWDNIDVDEKSWNVFLGSTNKNFWDYIVSVCFVSFRLSLEMFPQEPQHGIDYNTVRIMETSPFKEKVIKYSPYILADAINSVALLWFAAWERWELLKKEVI